MFGRKRDRAPSSEDLEHAESARRVTRKLEEYYAARGKTVRVHVTATRGPDGRVVYVHRTDIDLKEQTR